MLLLLGAISAAPFVGSLLLYYFWKPQSFSNYGDLVTAIPLAGAAIPVRDGSPFRVDDLRGKWVFLMADAGACDTNCRSKLYAMRQIRLTQGKDRERIERVWLVDDGVRPSADAEGAYGGTRIALVGNGDFLARLPAVNSPRDHIYLIDPFGNLMMRFPRDVDMQRMKKDVSRLIKLSGGWIQNADPRAQ